MKSLLIGLLLLTSTNAYAKIKIAVIDTGVDISLRPDLGRAVCDDSITFEDSNNPFEDRSKDKHGTNVAGLIAAGLDSKKYCLMILVPYDDSSQTSSEDLVKAVNYAISHRAKYINYSGGGLDPSGSELTAFYAAAEHGIKITVAAGNLNHDLSKSCNFYPACYLTTIKNKNFKVVGSDTYTLLGKYTNYGLVGEVYEDGTNQGTPQLTGTSQSSAIYLNKWIKRDANP